MHILIIASWYKRRTEEVHASFIEEQARMLMHAGIKVGVFHPYFIGGFKDRLKGNKTEFKHFNDNGLQTWYYGEMSIVPHFRSVIYKHLCRKAEKIFLEYAKEYGMPDIIHAHSVFMGGVVARYLSNKYKIPYIITEHSSKLITVFNSQNKIDRQNINRIIRNAKHAIFVSNFQLKKMKKLYDFPLDNMISIPNTINPIFQYDNTNNMGSFAICILGNLTENKNHLLLFNAIKLLKNRGVECFVKVIGNGETRKGLDHFVEINQLNKNIVFLGSLSRENVCKELINSHCLVSVSKFETFGVNLIEALGVGRPVISTNSGGPAEIVTKDNGILLKSFSVDELAEAIIYLKENYQAYNLEQIAADCHAKYSEEVIVNQLMRLYVQFSN